MKQLFVLFIILLLSSHDAAEFLTPCGAPVWSESPMVSPSSAPVWSESPLESPSHAPYLSPSDAPMLSPSSEPLNNDCSTVIYGMFDCLSFLNVGSTDLSPTKSCCDGVEAVLEYNPNCLCVALKSSRDMGFKLINTRALAMPSICNIPINPHCAVASSPTASISTPTPAAPTISPSEPPKNSSPPAVRTPSPPAVSTPSPPAVRTPSPPAVRTPSPPAVRTPSPSVTPSLPTVISSPVRTASPPTIVQSLPEMTAISPAITAPSPSKSGAKNLSVSKLFLRILMTISSFAYVFA